ncbi:MAG: CopG family transcriptional regulator [Alphaproteobacteria bacterium]|nr:CopG family transcriptional regulator [Alphaproteobacteria bacterium]MBU1526724.1 CopG family transcriptional regulator [Alphaproteobacteria bacterium]MBU2118635.1 CopG family transcriptional regulator [Alphaproteobacteria bacterium]MBU2351006.1 CopG family transcriptional regulator [Alphaproteobacteria bacterium]MBU2382849.1 CopG family transcriptional regulator [Alphaproteobacteria bacterium]
MRTTLTIDDDVLEAAKAQAEHEGKSVGKVISETFRAARRTSPDEGPVYRDGIRLLPLRGKPGEKPVTHELVRKLLDEFP